MMRTWSTVLFVAAASAVLISTVGHAQNVTYVAQLHALNTKVTGHAASGVATFTVRGDSLSISVRLHGVPGGMMHLQHFHGFDDGHQAACATLAADKNGDGIVDLIETEPASGTTMVPFNGDPVAMQIVSDTYPVASNTGTYSYEKTVSLSALGDAFAKKFSGHTVDLDHRVVYIHGVLPATTLPTTVASLGTIPAQVTLPIACGAIKRVK